MTYEPKESPKLFTIGLPYEGKRSVLLGLYWLLTWGDKKQEALIQVPCKDQIIRSDLSDVLDGKMAKSLFNGSQVLLESRVVRACSDRTFPPRKPYWSGGPVLMLWPNQKMVRSVLDSIASIPAICVVPGNTQEDVLLWMKELGARSVLHAKPAQG